MLRAQQSPCSPSSMAKSRPQLSARLGPSAENGLQEWPCQFTRLTASISDHGSPQLTGLSTLLELQVPPGSQQPHRKGLGRMGVGVNNHSPVSLPPSPEKQTARDRRCQHGNHESCSQ